MIAEGGGACRPSPARSVRTPPSRPGPAPGPPGLSESGATGLPANLPGWLSPLVLDTATSQAHFDHYNSAWGDPVHLDRLLQAYAIEKARIEARKLGHAVAEQPLA